MNMLREMAVFVEVARAGGFKRAAEVLGMPTSSVSRRVAELEKGLGLRLLNRTTRAVNLTEAGELYYARCRDIVEAARLAHEQLGELTDRPRGRLRVATTPDFARLFLAPLVTDYARLHPDVTLELDLSPQRVNLLTQNHDLAIRLGHQPDSGLISRRLGVIRTALYASPAFLASAGAPAKPEDIAGLAAIRNSNHETPDAWVLSDGRRKVRVEVSGPILANNYGMLRQLAVMGMGVTMLHDPMVAGDVRQGLLAPVLPGWILQETPVFVLTPSRLLPAKTRLFLDMLDRRIGPALQTG